MTGPVDDDYRLGPGDELTLIVTGDVELMYDLTVTREGYIIIPDVGQVLINGLTLSQAKGRLNERLARVYSGVQIGSTQSDLSVGRVRNKLIYVAGDVEVPNAYQMSGTATVFGALYRAGGPRETGSFRRIEVRRANQVLQRIDLYDYLLRGDKSGDVRLEQGDVVFVPLVGRQVTVVGGVRRPAIFELLDHEGLADALSFAGGGQANAAIERIVVDRILPPGQRQPGRERVLVDVTLSDLAGPQPVAVHDGDRVMVSEISKERRNRVTVKGDVQREGEYEYRPGMTALDLVNAASGLTPTAYTPIAHVIRLNPADSSTMLLRVNFDDPASPEYAGSMKLADLDELRVHGRAKLANPKKIEVFGYVKEEGTYPLAEGMTVEDAVLLAGGFQDGAAEGLVEVARRRPLLANRGDSLATVHRVAVSLGTTPSKGSAAPEPFRLVDGDQVFIRRHPGYQPLSTVELIGEVMYPGNYALAARGETVSEVVRRAGGLTAEGYAPGLRIYRDSIAVGIDLQKAMKRPGSKDDLVLRPGDRIEVPRFDATVLVTGAVAFESRVRYQPDLEVKDYIARAGGPKPEGIVGRTAVRYPNGELRTPTRPILFKRYPKVEPGSTIIVPVRGQAGSGPSFDSVLGRAAAVLGSIATIFLTANALK
jgi:protein involved in polysaccharide export with SLBB domain